jgi:hypothetical protein
MNNQATSLTKVTFEYSNGTKKYLDGEDLARWDTFCSQVALFAETHGMNPPWETVKWKEAGQDILIDFGRDH